MKKQLIILLTSLVIFQLGCKKQDELPGYITGYLYEKGTGKAIKNGNIWLVAFDATPSPRLEPLSVAKTDGNGFFRIKNERHDWLDLHYIIGQASGYYEMKEEAEYKQYPIEPQMTHIDIGLVRYGTVVIKLEKQSVNRYTQMQVFTSSRDRKSLPKDSLFYIKVSLNLHDTIRYSREEDGIHLVDVFPVLVYDSGKDTLKIPY